jgi:malonate decarboxylase beta subunit
MNRTAQQSFYEANARGRIKGLLDPGSFQEWLGPELKLTSPHLSILDAPVAFDDGVVTGCGRMGGAPVLMAAQEGGFMGGAVGEIHGAKITGLLERAQAVRPAAVVLVLESGGVRLHEANAGLIGVSEIMRALLNARSAGIPVVGLIGGQYGCFGGMGIVARLCDALIMSEEGRLGLSGPEVIETTMGVEEFDAADRALVWRTMGGKHRYLLGEIAELVPDDLAAFRAAAMAHFRSQPLTLEALAAQQQALQTRLETFGDSPDATDIWRKMGIRDPQQLPLLEADAFHATVDPVLGRRDAAQ